MSNRWVLFFIGLTVQTVSTRLFELLLSTISTAISKSAIPESAASCYVQLDLSKSLDHENGAAGFPSKESADDALRRTMPTLAGWLLDYPVVYALSDRSDENCLGGEELWIVRAYLNAPASDGSGSSFLR